MASPSRSASAVRPDRLPRRSARARKAGSPATRRRRVIAVAVAIALAAAVGLILGLRSSTRPPTVAATVNRDNAICRTYAERIARIQTPAFDPAKATRADLATAAHYLDQLVPLMRAEQDKIKAGGTPSGAQDVYASVFAALAAVVRAEQAARTAAHDGDLHAFRTAYQADAVDATRLSGVAQQFGLTACLGG